MRNDITLTQPLPGRERGFGSGDHGLNNASTAPLNNASTVSGWSRLGP